MALALNIIKLFKVVKYLKYFIDGFLLSRKTILGYKAHCYLKTIKKIIFFFFFKEKDVSV